MTDTVHEPPEVDNRPPPKRNRADSLPPRHARLRGQADACRPHLAGRGHRTGSRRGVQLRTASCATPTACAPGCSRTVMVGDRHADRRGRAAGCASIVRQQALAGLLGQHTDEADGAALVAEEAVPEPAPVATAAHRSPPPRLPTRCKILVLGDSLSTFVGQQMSALLADSKMVEASRSVWRNGTGLTNPAFFNWESGARSIMRDEAARRRRDAGRRQRAQRHDRAAAQTLVPGTAAWENEYERRARVVMRAMMQEGVQRVFWSGPPDRARPAVERRSTPTSTPHWPGRPRAVPGVDVRRPLRREPAVRHGGDDRRRAGGGTAARRHPLDVPGIADTCPRQQIAALESGIW